MKNNEKGKDVTADFVEMMKEIEQVEKSYKEMSKEELVELLVTKHIGEMCFEPKNHELDLWYFSDQETGSKYLTNEFPYICFSDSSKYPVRLTKGEVNIRVPKIMESMFPELGEYGTPTKIHLSVSF